MTKPTFRTSVISRAIPKFAALVCASTLSLAAMPAQGGSLSGTYILSPAQIATGFSVRVLGRGPVTGNFGKVSGKMILNQNQPHKSRVNVTVDLRTVSTNNDRVTGFLKSASMFDVKRFPLAEFQSTRVRITGETTAEVDGVLALRGKQKRTKLNVKLTDTKANGQVAFEVTGGFFRSFYGMDAGLPIYADKVNLTISGTGRRG